MLKCPECCWRWRSPLLLPHRLRTTNHAEANISFTFIKQMPVSWSLVQESLVERKYISISQKMRCSCRVVAAWERCSCVTSLRLGRRVGECRVGWLLLLLLLAGCCKLNKGRMYPAIMITGDTRPAQQNWT